MLIQEVSREERQTMEYKSNAIFRSVGKIKSVKAIVVIIKARTYAACLIDGHGLALKLL